MNGMNDPYKARKKRIITATVLFVAGLLLFAALIVTGFILRERYPALVYAACAITLAYIIASCAILFKVSRRIDEPEAGDAPEEPYVIKHPLFKRISDQYDRDGLADFVNYVSLRGWKLGYVERLDDSIEFIFIRKERQVGVVLYDGKAEVSVDLQSDHPQDTMLSMDAYSEPIELWNAIITAGRDAARSTAES